MEYGIQHTTTLWAIRATLAYMAYMDYRPFSVDNSEAYGNPTHIPSGPIRQNNGRTDSMSETKSRGKSTPNLGPGYALKNAQLAAKYPWNFNVEEAKRAGEPVAL